MSNNRDETGMPVQYYSYWIVESDQPRLGADRYIASVVPLTDGPEMKQRHFIGDGMHQATAHAIDALKRLPGFDQLKVQESSP